MRICLDRAERQGSRLNGGPLIFGVALLFLAAICLTACSTSEGPGKGAAVRPTPSTDESSPTSDHALSPSTPTSVVAAELGVGLRSLPGGQVSVTGVMGRYPNRGPNGKALGPLWVVFSSLGSETSAPTVLVAINQAKDLSYVFGAPDPRLQPHEGKLVTVEGPISSGLLDLFRSVRPKVIRDAPADVQAKTSGLGSIVRPGPWWDHVSWAYTKVWDLERQHTNLLTVEAARKKFGSRVAVPTSPLAGRMLGIFVWREAGGTQPALQAIFDTNLEYGVSLAPAEPQYDKNWLWGRNRAKGPGWQRRPPYLELVRIASRPGAIEYLRSPEDSRTPAWGLGWRDGQWDCSLDCRLSPTSAPAAADLLEIARSAYR